MSKSDTDRLIATAKEMRRQAKIEGTPEHAKAQATAAKRANEVGYQAAVRRWGSA